MLDEDIATIVVEVEDDLLREAEKVLRPYGMTPEQAAVEFFRFCVKPATRKKAMALLLQCKKRADRKYMHTLLNFYTKGRGGVHLVLK